MTSDLNTTFGHRLIYNIRGEAATFIPHSSFLTPHSSRAFIQGQGAARPVVYPKTPNLLFFVAFPHTYMLKLDIIQNYQSMG
ncbi:hypothetical protein I3400192H8_17870 [Dialister sp. i34-0019-2H8]